MELVTVVLAILFAVLISEWITRFLPIPLPLVQIALGAVLAVAPLPSAKLNSEIFFLVFLPPLLFIDGWRIPKRDLFRDAKTILALAIGLVVFTVFGMGFFIAWLIPAMPLAVAFALAAVLSPTDPIAVSAVTERATIPARLMHILEGEALLNDASGLVCLRFAIAAAVTGRFSPAEASLAFVWLAAGGIVVGAGLTVAVTYVEAQVLRRGSEDPGSQTLFSLLIPFGAYLTAEAVHVSGVLAVVAAGIAMNYVEIQGQAMAITRMRRTAVWDTVQLVANGAIFVLLGEQLPGIVSQAVVTVRQGEHHNGWWLVLYVVAITLALMALRFLWVFLTIRLVLLKAHLRGETAEGLTWHLVLVTTLAGVKGAVTLAGILTLPLILPNDDPLPARDLAIFLAMGVILLSLVGAAMTLPALLPRLRLPPEDSQEAEEEAARAIANERAMRAIERLQAELAKGEIEADVLNQAAARALERYKRDDGLGEDDAGHERRHALQRAEKRLRLAGLKAERNALFALRRARKIEDGLLRRLVRELDLLEARCHTLPS